MLVLSKKAKKSFADEHTEKFFLVVVGFPNLNKFYTHNSITLYDATKNTYYNFIGSLLNEIKFGTGFKLNDNSVSMPSISASIIDDAIDLLSMSKQYEINFSEISLYFSTNELNLDEALPLFKGVIGIDTIDIEMNPFNLSMINIDNKYDKNFPPLILNNSLSFCLLTNDAEKYIGESIPIIFGLIENPGFPIPIFYDNGTTLRKYAISNHQITDLTGLAIYADGILISGAYYTLSYDAVNNIHLISVTSDANYQTYFKGKKITCSCRGLLYSSTNPSIGDVVLYMLQNYSNLSANLIDLQGIYTHKAYLSTYKVARFFNSSSTIFDTIKELTLEFPFIINTRGFKKSITCVDSLNIPYTFELQKYKHYLERLKGIKITKHTDLYNKISIRYKFDALNNRWKGFSYIDSTNNNDCLVLKGKLGGLVKEKEIVDLYSVSDSSTATNILNYLSKVFCFNKYEIQYKCKHNIIFLEIGDGILLTDEELNINKKKFIITNKIIGRDFVFITIENVERVS